MSENIVPQSPDQDINPQTEPTVEPQLANYSTLTKEEIVIKIKAFLNSESLPARSEIDALKQAFYKLKSTETDALRAEYMTKNDGSSEGFVVEPDLLEEELKTSLTAIKEKRAKLVEEEEKVKEKNLERKLKIIDNIKALTESTDDFGKLYKEFKDLQQEWNDIKLVPQGKVKELWRSYQIYTEKFYDLLKINNELRDYDFKKNLELKTAICESVEVLNNEPDIISAFYQLQNFHQQWREIGPVAKELRDELWERFKNASTEINKKYQEHFVSLKASEDDNLAEKTAICEALKAIDYSLLVSAKAWDEKTKEVIELQSKWKKIGFVPRKVNTQIFEEYRSLCDNFFEKKADFFRMQKDEMEGNLEKKKALCERANSLKDSTDWKKTGEELVSIQKEWKTIGPVPRKYSDTLWKEFIAACDYFFEQRNKATSNQKEEEVANLNMKKELIQRINEMDQSLENDEAFAQLKKYMEEWNSIGFVPFKEKDKIYKEYQSALDIHFDRLKINKSERRLQNFKSTIEDMSKSDKSGSRLILKERDKLIHQFNKIKSELQTYENNMGFLSISKGSGGLLKEMNSKIENLKNELDIITKKIEAIDENMDQNESK